MLFDQASQPLFYDMGIDLRGGDVGMAEKLLHRAQVGAPLQEMAGEGVTEHMRRDPGGLDPGGKRQRLELLAETLAGQMLASG